MFTCGLVSGEFDFSLGVHSQPKHYSVWTPATVNTGTVGIQYQTIGPIQQNCPNRMSHPAAPLRLFFFSNSASLGRHHMAYPTTLDLRTPYAEKIEVSRTETLHASEQHTSHKSAQCCCRSPMLVSSFQGDTFVASYCPAVHWNHYFGAN